MGKYICNIIVALFQFASIHFLFKLKDKCRIFTINLLHFISDILWNKYNIKYFSNLHTEIMKKSLLYNLLKYSFGPLLKMMKLDDTHWWQRNEITTGWDVYPTRPPRWMSSVDNKTLISLCNYHNCNPSSNWMKGLDQMRRLVFHVRPENQLSVRLKYQNLIPANRSMFPCYVSDSAGDCCCLEFLRSNYRNISKM